MAKCAVCNNLLTSTQDNTLTLHNVPESTFNFSTETCDLNIISCGFCGAVQLIDVPLSKDYDVVYRSIGASTEFRENKKQQLKNLIEKYSLQDKKCIEFGCGNGQFLEIFKELNLNCAGVEFGIENYSECVAKNFQVYNNLEFISKNKYDAFFTFHYLEHFPEPVLLIGILFLVLKNGGVGVIEVPSYDLIEKNNIWLEFTKDHRLYYRKKTISILLLNFGFSIESIEENEETLCLTVVVKKPNYDFSFIGMKNKIKEDVIKFKETIDKLNGSFAVYGAGHYSQLFLNLINDKYKIKPIRIFDSNKQKCGNQICGVTIEHKDDIINTRDCGNIIIICGIYNDEVYKSLLLIDKNIIKVEQILKWD